MAIADEIWFEAQAKAEVEASLAKDPAVKAEWENVAIKAGTHTLDPSVVEKLTGKAVTQRPALGADVSGLKSILAPAFITLGGLFAGRFISNSFTSTGIINKLPAGKLWIPPLTAYSVYYYGKLFTKKNKKSEVPLFLAIGVGLGMMEMMLPTAPALRR